MYVTETQSATKWSLFTFTVLSVENLKIICRKSVKAHWKGYIWGNNNKKKLGGGGQI